MTDGIVNSIYDTWYNDNKPLMISGHWNLIDRSILELPQRDIYKGLNLLYFLSPETNAIIDNQLLPKITEVIAQKQWIIPPEDRHITLLDIIPHNSPTSLDSQHELFPTYIELIQQTINSFHEPLTIEFKGIFASPDGITIQGYPSPSIIKFRTELRSKLTTMKVLNLEHTKYVTQTAHTAWIKFITPLNGEQLIKVVDSLRNFPLGSVSIQEMILTISKRYDKTKTIETIKRFTL